MLNQFLIRKAAFRSVKPCFRSLSLMKYRNFSTFTVDLYENRFLTSNMFCLVRNPVLSQPFISVTHNIKIPIEDGKTLEDMERETLDKHNLSSLDFYTHDGAKIARSTSSEALSSLPYFKLVIDKSKEYIVISEESFNKYELEGNVKNFYDYCKENEMNDDKALLLSKYCSDVVDKISKKKKWSKDEFIHEAFEGLVQVAHEIREEKEVLQAQYDLLKDHRRPLDIVRGKIEREAEMFARRRIFTMFYFIAAQYVLVQYGTYILFSWDIMEPLTCGMTLGDAVLAYMFWAKTKSSYTLSGIFNHFYNKRKNKLAKRENFDQENYEKIQTALSILKKRIRELK